MTPITAEHSSVTPSSANTAIEPTNTTLQFRKKPVCALCAAVIAGGIYTGGAQAQERPLRAGSALLEEVVVTARKREEASQDVPLSITAYGEDQLDALKVRNLVDLAVGMPSVVLDEIGTSRGYANFAIRGVGITSSIPSIDPAVGLVVDGVYLGTNAGVVFDNFDIQSVEVLRGPQGTLFGRNVTGGAVLLNTKVPTEEFEFTARTSYEFPEDGGASYIVQGSVSGGITDTLAAKLAVYYNDDDGVLVNDFDGADHGAYEQTIIRPVIAWRPTDTFELIARYEYQDVEADGASGQSHTNGNGVAGTPFNADRDSFDFNIDEPGFQTLEVDFLNLTFNWDVLGGTITNVFGWRESEATSGSDIDAQPIWVFHSDTFTEYNQWSNELRYNGLFADDKLNLTGGVYYFDSELLYDENRRLLGVLTGGQVPAANQEGGGENDVTSFGVFLNVDYDISDRLTLTAGVRWTEEEKDARITNLVLNSAPCFIGAPNGPSYAFATTPCTPDFIDSNDWSFVSPKFGFMYELTDSSRVYASVTRGYRSGGYNVRNTEVPLSFNADGTANYEFGPGPFDEEEVTTWELGYKSEWSGGQLNIAAFYTEGEDMQRDINLPSVTSGVLQLTQNTADIEITGIEIDGTFRVTDGLTVQASLGVMDPEYTDVRFDLSGDGVIDSIDENLNIPRAPELTYSISAIYDVDVGSYGYISSRLSYAYRDETSFNDNNLGFILEQEILDASVDFHTNDGTWVLSLFGRNLLDTVRHGGDTPLGTIGPVFVGGTFAPLSAPATYGVEVRYNL
ncbi:MAG: TonB-dependent receptor [Pseudomonadota bacterium]